MALLLAPWGPQPLALEREVLKAATLRRDLSGPELVEAVLLDEEVARAVEYELRREETFPAGLVGLRVERGIVLLGGRVPTLLAKARTLARVDMVLGVRGVVDLLVVDPPLRADRAIEEDVSRTLDRRGVAVAVRGGLVLLSGSVASWGERDIAIRTTAGVGGVRAIEDRLVVAPAAPRPDAEIAREVKGRLAHDVWVEDRNIEVIVEKRVVRLRGFVASEVEAVRARSHAAVPGVTYVDAAALKVSPAGRAARAPSSLELRTDEEIAAASAASLALDPRLAWSSPVVAVDSGLVTLAGTVDGLLARRAAVADVRNTRGVLGVRDHLEVARAGRFDDPGIRNRVRAAFRKSSVLATAAIVVAVHDRNVVLTGCVDTRAELALADEVAAGVAGVASIESHLRLGCRPGDAEASLRDVKIDFGVRDGAAK